MSEQAERLSQVRTPKHSKITLYREDERIVIGYWDPGEGPSIVETLTYYDSSGHRTEYEEPNIIGRFLECVITAQKAFGFTE